MRLLDSTLLISCILALSLIQVNAFAFIPRQETSTTSAASATPSSTETTSSTISSTSSSSSTTSATLSDTTISSTSSTTSSAASTETTSVLPSDTTSSLTSLPPNTPTTPVVLSTSTDPAGNVVTLMTTVTTPLNTPSISTSAEPSSTSTVPPTSTRLGTGSIVGLSVAGGVAVIGIVAFFVWKFTRKRFSDFDDNEAIKWPDLNTHGEDHHPMPTHNTGRAGFETGSETSLSRGVSEVYPSDGYNSADPYSVPALPHMNPNQPYRDDPNAAGYYDPYRGPLPPTFNDGNSVDSHGNPVDWQNDGYAMTQLNQQPQPLGLDTGRMSPRPPPVGYGDTRPASPFDTSPAMMMGRRSPGPQAAYDPGMTMGRSSPGPQAAYDVRQ